MSQTIVQLTLYTVYLRISTMDDYDAVEILRIAANMYDKKRYASSAYLAYVALCEFEKTGCKSGVEASIVTMQFAINGVQNYFNSRLNNKPEFVKALEVVKKILMLSNSPNLSKILNEVARKDSFILEEVVCNNREFSLN